MPEFSGEEQAALAGVIALQRGKVKEDTLAELELSPDWQHDVLVLSAILRIAVGLDASESQLTQIQQLEISEYGGYREVKLMVDGPQALIDARSAQDDSQLWNSVGLPHLIVLEASEAERPPLPQAPETPGVQTDDPMSEAGRKVMLYHFAEVLRHEDGTRQGEDIEELHVMRVATRRLRAAFDIFGDAFKEKSLQRYLKRLRATGRALGRVRDLDVFMEKAQAYLQTLPEADRPGLDPLLQEWKVQRDRARDEMMVHLNSKEYQDFKREFGLFLETPGLGARKISQFPPEPYQVCTVAPTLVYTRFGEARSFDRILYNAQIQQLHALRIEFKKLRYTLEFFQEVLGKEAKGLISVMKNLQDHLGDLNDADVATQILQDFLQQWDRQQMDRPLAERQNPEGVVNYLAYRHAERYRLMVSFQQAWASFIRPEFRRDLAQAVSVL
ncbi:MAG TPA: CHAD domain-containing protein, partial [Anaerolineales bacterium]